MPPQGKASPVAQACLCLIITGVVLYGIILHQHITSLPYSEISTGTCTTVTSSVGYVMSLIEEKGKGGSLILFYVTVQCIRHVVVGKFASHTTPVSTSV